MTLGNSQPPLSRRQAREAAQALEQARALEPAPSTATAVEDSPSSTPDEAVPISTLTRRELRALYTADVTDAFELESETLDDRPDDESNPAPGGARVDSTRDSAGSNSLNPPVGHWSIDQGDEDDQDDQVAGTAGPARSLDEVMALGVGAGGIPTTTNALILPSIPNQGEISKPMANTGEILITGSFDLPSSLGATGQHPSHVDSADTDHMTDHLEDVGPTDNAPVSASRAVSTQGSTRNVMTPPNKRGVSLPVVLVVSTAALAVSVGALLLGGHLLQIF